MFCRNCGKQLEENTNFCSNCGLDLRVENDYNYQQYNSNSINKPYIEKDAPNIGFAFLSFFFPLVGLILYLVWKDQFPLKAKSCGKGALINVIIGIGLCFIFLFIFVFWFPMIIYSSSAFIFII